MFSPRLILIAGILAVASSCYGQDSLLLRNYQFVKRTDAWLTSQNAAGLTRLQRPSTAEAELSLTKSRGGLVDWYQSPNALQATARVESFTRVSERTVLFGAMTCNSFSGHDMAATAFISPHAKPFDLVEDSLTGAGTKHRDTYRLSGAVGVDACTLGRHTGRYVAAGIRLDYTAANNAKYKDLRHKGKLMDMTFTAGIRADVARGLSLGAHYLYRRTAESLTFSLYGREDKVYKTLIDYGAFMGRVEQWGSGGYTDKGREQPLVDNYNGAALQLSLESGPLAVYSSLAYARRKGYYGRKSPATIVYTRHHAHLLGCEARVAYTLRQALLTAHVALNSENLENLANNYRERTNSSGAYYYEYYHPVKTANKLWQKSSIALTADVGIRGECPTYTFTACLSRRSRQLTAYLYPYYRQQHLHTTQTTLMATRNCIAQRGVWTFTINASYQKGGGAPATDRTFVQPSDKQSAPATMDAWLWREYQHTVAPQYSAGGSIAYAFALTHHSLKPHIRLAATHRKANHTYEYSCGKDCTTLELALGCSF